MTSALNVRIVVKAIYMQGFGLVLLNTNLPDGNDYEMLQLIKPEHPIIVISLIVND